MSPSVVPPPTDSKATILALRKTLTCETEPLARRFRALFSLKHLASGEQDDVAIPAVEAIAAAFASPSALLKHELAYCLGQSKNVAAVPCLQAVLDNRDEDAMCRHEAAEALGAIGDVRCLEMLRKYRDLAGEVDVVTETCEIAAARIEWEMSEEGKQERLRKRYVGKCASGFMEMGLIRVVTLHPSIQRPLPIRPAHNPLTISRLPFWTPNSLSLCDIGPCLRSGTWRRRRICRAPSLQSWR